MNVLLAGPAWRQCGPSAAGYRLVLAARRGKPRLSRRQPQCAANERRHRVRLVQRQAWQRRIWRHFQRRVRDHGQEAGVLRVQRRLAQRRPVDLDARDGGCLKPSTSTRSAGASRSSCCASVVRVRRATHGRWRSGTASHHHLARAPARKRARTVLPGGSISKSWWLCLITLTASPRAQQRQHGFDQVVLPLPERLGDAENWGHASSVNKGQTMGRKPSARCESASKAPATRSEIPAMQGQRAGLQRPPHAGQRLQVAQRDQDGSLSSQRAGARRPARPASGSARAGGPARRYPSSGSGSPARRPRRRAAPSPRMPPQCAPSTMMRRPELVHRELDRGQHAVMALVAVGRRHQVGDVAHGEDVAGIATQQHGRVHPRIAAADQQGAGVLAVAQVAVEQGARPRSTGTGNAGNRR